MNIEEDYNIIADKYDLEKIVSVIGYENVKNNPMMKRSLQRVL